MNNFFVRALVIKIIEPAGEPHYGSKLTQCAHALVITHNSRKGDDVGGWRYNRAEILRSEQQFCSSDSKPFRR